MRRLVYIFVAMLVAGAVSCHRTSETEARLIAIDSLISSTGATANYGTGASPADSALALLNDIDTASLRGENRAYHALLTAQALYKAYIPATSDSIINRAWDYYQDHGSYDRRIRALLYKGTTAEETGNSDSAMYWYKRTELESRPDDHYHRGYALMNMGILYQQNYENNEAIKKFRNALESFKTMNYNSCFLFCCQQLAQLYQNIDVRNDSSLFYINLVKNISEKNNDTLYLKTSLSTLVCKLYYDSCYKQAKDLSIKLLNNYNNISFECWHYIVQAYANLGMIDSAEFFFNNSPDPISILDSSLYYHSLSLIYSLNGDWRKAHTYDVKSDSIAETEVLSHRNQLLLSIEKETEQSFISSSNLKKHTHRNLYAIIIIMIVFALGFVIMKTRLLQKKKTELQLRQQIKWLEDNNQKFLFENDKINQKQNTIQHELATVKERLHNQLVENNRLRESQTNNEFIQSLYAQLSLTFSQNIQPLGDIASDYFQVKNNATLFMKRFYSRFNSLWTSKDMWQQIENYINHNHNNCYYHFFKLHPNINDEEQHLVLLLLLGFNSMAIAICLGYKSQEVVYSVKSRLKKKLKIDGSIEDYISELEKSI